MESLKDEQSASLAERNNGDYSLLALLCARRRVSMVTTRFFFMILHFAMRKIAAKLKMRITSVCRMPKWKNNAEALELEKNDLHKQ